MTTVGKVVYLEGGDGGYPVIGLARRQRKRGSRVTKRSLRWKAPWVRPKAVVFASDSLRRPFKARRVLRSVASPAR
jgi:hypothetical protein